MSALQPAAGNVKSTGIGLKRSVVVKAHALQTSRNFPQVGPTACISCVDTLVDGLDDFKQ